MDELTLEEKITQCDERHYQEFLRGLNLYRDRLDEFIKDSRRAFKGWNHGCGLFYEQPHHIMCTAASKRFAELRQLGSEYVDQVLKDRS